MREAFIQSLENLRANKLRSFLTMFGILWGMISVVILSATGEGFRRGNEKVLRELGQNIGIVWGGRTSLQAGGERAGRQVFLTVDDARAVAAEASMVAVRQPGAGTGRRAREEQLQRRVRARHGHGASLPEDPHDRTRIRPAVHVDRRSARWPASPSSGTTWRTSCSASGSILGETLMLDGVPYTVVGKIRKKEQDSNYNGPDNNKIFVPFAAMLQRHAAKGRAARQRVRHRRGAATVGRRPVARECWTNATGRIEDIVWPLENNVRAVLARRHGFDPERSRGRHHVGHLARDADVRPHDRSHDAIFSRSSGVVTLALGGIGVMNIMLVAVKERTREIGVRKALGATTRSIQQQFFMEGFFLTLLSGGAGMLLALGLCSLVNLAADAEPFRRDDPVVAGGALGSLATLVVIGIVTSTYPARRAAELPPVEALRFEM